VEDARRRSEEFVANAHMHAAVLPLSEQEEAEAAHQRADADEEHQPNDFLPAPSSQNPP
jgi:hypothetical protein